MEPVPPPLLSTGKTSGQEEIHVVLTELVTSWINGAVEKVPMAMNCAVSCKLPTDTETGIIVSESNGDGGAVSEAVSVAEADTTVLSGFVNSAVMVVVPGP